MQRETFIQTETTDILILEKQTFFILLKIVADFQAQIKMNEMYVSDCLIVTSF